MRAPSWLDDLPPILPSELFAAKPNGALRAWSRESGRESSIASTAQRSSSNRPAAETKPSRSSSGRRRSASSKRDRLLAIGAVIDKYRLDELLGTGAFAAVYRATHLLLRAPVAIKMLLPAVVAANPKLAAALCDEARFAARVDHPNVVRVRDVSHSESLSYIVLEYVHGRSLSQRLKSSGRMPIGEVLALALGVTRGLDAAAKCGVVHRDVKPSNILIAEDGTPKLIDLGLAKNSFADLEFERDQAGPFHRSVVGTPTYMSPEQVSDPASVDRRSDVYSLGVTLYHALTGAPPFVARRIRDLPELHARPLPALESVLPELEPAVARLITRMLSRDRTARPDYSELIAALESAAPRR